MVRNILTAAEARNRFFRDDDFDQRSTNDTPKAYNDLKTAFDEYLAKYADDQWALGYNYALKVMGLSKS